MAMTGMRTVTAGGAEEERAPPEVIVSQHAPRAFRRLSERHRAAVTELMHWGYGAGGGVLFAMLPETVRRRRGIGVAYGLAIWAVFETMIGPALGVPRPRQRPILWRVAIAADHVLYGVIVAGRLAPEPARLSADGDQVATSEGPPNRAEYQVATPVLAR
jgi:hypothetical protein